jgi:hypothetical protein
MSNKETKKEPTKVSKEESEKIMQEQVNDLSTKADVISRQMIEIFEKNNLTPFQSLLLMKSLSDGILKMIDAEADKQDGVDITNDTAPTTAG